MPKTKKKHQKGGRESLKKQFETMITLQKTYSKNLRKWKKFYQRKYGPLLTEAAELIDKFNDIPQKEMEDDGVKAVKKMVCEHICKTLPMKSTAGTPTQLPPPPTGRPTFGTPTQLPPPPTGRPTITSTPVGRPPRGPGGRPPRGPGGPPPPPATTTTPGVLDYPEPSSPPPPIPIVDGRPTDNDGGDGGNGGEGPPFAQVKGMKNSDDDKYPMALEAIDNKKNPKKNKNKKTKKKKKKNPSKNKTIKEKKGKKNKTMKKKPKEIEMKTFPPNTKNQNYETKNNAPEQEIIKLKEKAKTDRRKAVELFEKKKRKLKKKRKSKTKDKQPKHIRDLQKLHLVTKHGPKKKKPSATERGAQRLLEAGLPKAPTNDKPNRYFARAAQQRAARQMPIAPTHTPKPKAQIPDPILDTLKQQAKQAGIDKMAAQQAAAQQKATAARQKAAAAAKIQALQRGKQARQNTEKKRTKKRQETPAATPRPAPTINQTRKPRPKKPQNKNRRRKETRKRQRKRKKRRKGGGETRQLKKRHHTKRSRRKN